jgi:4-aminobutyrate aminotransferase
MLGKGLGGGIFSPGGNIDEYTVFHFIGTPMKKSDRFNQVGLHNQYIEENKLLAKVRVVVMLSKLSRLKEKFSLIEMFEVSLCVRIGKKDRTTKEKSDRRGRKVMYACLKRGLSFKVSGKCAWQLSPATISRKS